MIVTSMKLIVGRMVLNQCSGKEWLLLEAIMDLVRIYTYCSGDDAVDNVSKHLATMVEDRGNSQDAEDLQSNLLEVHSKILSWVKDMLTNVLAPLLQMTAPTKYHYWSAIILDPRYVMEIKDIKTFHQSENVDTKTLVQHMMPNFYEYIMAAELSVHKNTPLILVGNNQYYLYFHNNPNRMHSLLYEAIILERIGSEFVIYQNTVSGTEITDNFDVLNWFQIQQMKFPMLTRFAYIIHSTSPLKTENERDLSLAEIYTASQCVILSVESISDLLFINIKSSALGRNNTIDVFGGSLDYVADIDNNMESNPYPFAYASNTK